MIRLLLSCLALFSLASCANLNKKPKFTLTFHTQGTDMDSPRSVFPYPLPGEGGRRVIMKWMPEFSQENISAYQPFKADNGNGHGAMFKLDFRGANALNMVSSTQHGQIILTLLNGKPIGHLVLDRPSGDGIITVWEGIPDSVLAFMAKKYPPIKGLKSVSSGHPDMLPTTDAEKKRAVDNANAQKKLDDKAAAEKAKTEGGQAKPAEKTKASGTNDGLNPSFNPEPELPLRKTPIPFSEPAIPVPPNS